MTRAGRMPFPGRTLLVCVLVAAPPGFLHAWDGPTHVAIVAAASRLSPAVEKRIPAQFHDVFLQGLEQGDPRDSNCLSHRGAMARRRAAVEAQRILSDLTGPTAEQRPYQRAMLLGRYLHYVADCAVPGSLAEGRAVAVPDFFSNKDFVVFRETRALKTPLSGSLETIGSEAQWADEAHGGESFVFRLAVNLTADALLLTSGAGAVQEPAEPIVLFVINPLDNGTGMTHSELYESTSYTYVGRTVFESYSFGERRVGGGGVPLPDLLHRFGVQVVEWRSRREGEKVSVRALLFNNQPKCASDIVIGSRGSTASLTGIELSPLSLRNVALEIPSGGEPDFSSLKGVLLDCPPAVSMPPGVSTRLRLVANATGAPPRFDGEVTEVRITEGPAPRRPAPRH